MDEQLTALAMTGATTIMAAMATSAWAAARAGVIRLFHRSGSEEQRTLEAQLDREAAMVQQEQDPDSARQDFVGGWRRQLVVLLSEHPEARSELEALVKSVEAQLPHKQQTVQIQANIAKDNGFAAGAQGGNVIVNYSSAAPQPIPTRSENGG